MRFQFPKWTIKVKIKLISKRNEGTSGKEVGYKMLEAYRFAQMDPYRATTHNKGIMNGVDAVAIATGQDWRAIESAAHAFAVNQNGY